MLPSNVRNLESGFNLAEISITLIVAGILASVSASSLWGMYQQFETDDAFNQVRGALQEAQVQAIRRSQNCTVTIDTVDLKITGDQFCLLETRQLPNNITIAHTGVNTITFNIRGGIGAASAKTIVLYDNYQSKKKCLVISAGIGIMRSGEYTGDLGSPINPASCITS